MHNPKTEPTTCQMLFATIVIVIICLAPLAVSPRLLSPSWVPAQAYSFL